MVGAPVIAPARATRPSSTQPSAVPATIATTVATNDWPGATRNVAVTGMSRLIPRLAQRPELVGEAERAGLVLGEGGRGLARRVVMAMRTLPTPA